MKRILLIAITMLLGVSPAYAQTCGSALMPAFTAAQATNLCNRGFNQISPGQIQVGDGTATAPSMSFASDPDTGITRQSANVITFTTGANNRAHITGQGVTIGNQPEASSGPLSGALSATGGSGTNVAGADLIIRGGYSSGNGAGGVLRFQTAAAGASGSSTNTHVERVRIKQGGQLRFVPLAADPTLNVEAGDVYYNSGTNKLRVYNGSIWVDLH